MSVEKKIDEIHRALVGDEYGNEGLVKKVDKNTRFRLKLKWVGAIFVGAGVGIERLAEWIYKMLHS